MEQFVDIHAHIIPGIDDGPSDLEDSLDMARAAAAAGTRTLVSTPHLRQDFPDVHLEELGARCQSLREAIDAEGIPLTLVCGAEVSLLWAMAASQEQLVLASCAQRGTDLLIETPFTTVSGIDQHLFQIRAKGFRVTLAHPERSVEFQHDIELLEALVTQEILIQVNAKSLMGGSRKSASVKSAHTLCARGLVHVVASDGHRANDWRPVTALREGAESAAAIVGEPRAAWMTHDVPAAIVGGEPLPPAPELQSGSHRRGLFGRRS